ncbi:MAG: acyl-CoA dehydrogenase, partial [Leptolyngbyaceae cyanobacterium]
WNSSQHYAFIEGLTRTSGALAFLYSQHQGAIRLLAESSNAPLQSKYLGQAVTGEMGLGIGYSHLRRSPSPLAAIATDEGFVLEGTLPWVTGSGIFQYCLVAAALPTQQAVFVVIPFQSVEEGNGATPLQRDERCLVFSAPMPLAALPSTQTVTATLENWLVPHDLVVDIKPAGWLRERDRRNPLSHSFYCLGCAQAGLDVVAQQQERGEAIALLYHALDDELTRCRASIYAALSEGTTSDRFALRAWAIELMVRCAHAAVTVSRGAAVTLSHPAQRIYRESLAFTVFGQTEEVMNASLRHMTRQYSSPLAKH